MIERWNKQPLLPADYSECLLRPKVIEPKYKFPLIIRALRAYSVLPPWRDRAIIAVFKIDRTRESAKPQRLIERLALPHPEFGKPRRVGVFADGEMAEDAEKAGAIVLRPPDIPDHFQKRKERKGRICHSYLATVDVAAKARMYARDMRDRTPTDKKNMIFRHSEKLCRRIQEMRYDRGLYIHKLGVAKFPIGTIWMSEKQLQENLACVVDAIKTRLASKTKGEVQITKAYLNMSFGRKFELNLDDLPSVDK